MCGFLSSYCTILSYQLRFNPVCFPGTEGRASAPWRSKLSYGSTCGFSRTKESSFRDNYYPAGGWLISEAPLSNDEPPATFTYQTTPYYTRQNKLTKRGWLPVVSHGYRCVPLTEFFKFFEEIFSTPTSVTFLQRVKERSVCLGLVDRLPFFKWVALGKSLSRQFFPNLIGCYPSLWSIARLTQLLVAFVTYLSELDEKCYERFSNQGILVGL